MKFGLYDSEDNVWMGNEDGPLLYGEERLAKVSAMVTDRCLHQPQGRTRAIPFDVKSVKLRDTVPLLETPVDAIAQIEEGRA
jgi:hypothetical protein